MSAPLGELAPEQFLAQYWQKQPCLIRQAIPGFAPLLDGDDLAGLACEEMAESRLVRGSFESADWSLEHGPFSEDRFTDLPESGWTLLVQDVEKHYEPLQDLMQRFNFIPNWRLDDLMISFAAPGGSVGPHVDQYDVFLLQAEGRRRWQIATVYDPALLGGCPLNVLQRFEPEHEWVLEPGDMLYLPPNIAHHGVALDAGMTWSVGARAPSGADLLQGLGEWLALEGREGGRYADPQLEPAARPGEIDRSALDGLRELMRSGIDANPDLDNFLAAFLSRFRLAHDPVPPPSPVNAQRLRKAMERGVRLMRNPWTRLTWIENTRGARLYAAGQAHDCSVWLAMALCSSDQPRIGAGKLDESALATVTQLINDGHFLLVSGD